MTLKVVQSINVDIADGRTVVFSTKRDQRVVCDEFVESASAIMDLRAGEGLQKVHLGGVLESHNLYIIADQAVVFRIVPPGLSVLDVPDYVLIPNTPNFLGIKLVEIWVANPTAVDAFVTVASAGTDILSVPIVLPPPPVDVSEGRDFLCNTSVGVGDLVYISGDNFVSTALDNMTIEPVFGIVVGKPDNTVATVLLRGEIPTSLARGRVFLSVTGTRGLVVPATGYVHNLGISYGLGRMFFQPSIHRAKRSV